jgi:hypothetical protein
MVKKEDKVVTISLVLLVFLFLLSTRTLNSGYHFVDDHEIIKIKNDLNSASLGAVAKKWVDDDFNVNKRFRPFYYVIRVVETRLLGSDFLLWSVFNGLLFCLSLLCFYFGIRNLKFALGESIVFLVITFLGPQSSVWWRLGPGESLGMVMLGLAFYFMSKSNEGKNYRLFNWLFIFFLILASLTKESFLLIIPAMIFFKIWNEKTVRWSSLKESYTKNLILIVPLAVFVIELFFIRKYIGTDNSGLNSSPISNLSSILKTLIKFIETYLNILIVSLILAAICWRSKTRIVRFDLFSTFFFILIFIPNILLYARSGLDERYLLPVSFGLGFLVITYIRSFENDARQLQAIATILFLVSFVPFVFSTTTAARRFSKDGYSTKKLLSAISANYQTGTPAMVIVDPVVSYEKSVSLKTYLNYVDKIDLFGYAMIKDQNNSDYAGIAESWKLYFDKKLPEDLTSKPELLIFLDKHLIDNFFKTSDYHHDDYFPIDVGDSSFALFRETPFKQ